MTKLTLDRRKFLALTAVAAGSVAIAGCGVAPQGRALDALGIQLYTLRSLMEKSVPDTLNALAKIGYDSVEFAGYFGHSPQEIAAMLSEVGLVAPAAHLPLSVFEDDAQFEVAVSAADVVGHNYLVLPWLQESDRTIVRYREIAAVLNKRGEELKAMGKHLAYHNHEFEFETVDGETPMEVLLTETDASFVKFELDLFWMHVADVDPLSLIDRYPGRFPLFHIKDRSVDGNMVNVGDGTIDFARVFKAGEKSGMKHIFVENDHPADPLAFAKASYEHLAALRY